MPTLAGPALEPHEIFLARSRRRGASELDEATGPGKLRVDLRMALTRIAGPAR